MWYYDALRSQPPSRQRSKLMIKSINVAHSGGNIMLFILKTIISKLINYKVARVVSNNVLLSWMCWSQGFHLFILVYLWTMISLYEIIFHGFGFMLAYFLPLSFPLQYLFFTRDIIIVSYYLICVIAFARPPQPRTPHLHPTLTLPHHRS